MKGNPACLSVFMIMVLVILSSILSESKPIWKLEIDVCFMDDTGKENKSSPISVSNPISKKNDTNTSGSSLSGQIADILCSFCDARSDPDECRRLCGKRIGRRKR